MSGLRIGWVALLTALALAVPATATAQTTAEAFDPAAGQSAIAPVSELPSMSIDLTDPDPAKNTLSYVHANKDNEVSVTVDLVDPDDPANALTGLVGVLEGRGNFTWTLDKKPYQLKFATATPVLGMGAHRTWVLLANHADPSLMRNKLAYDLAADFGLAYSPESRFVDLTVDGQLLGSYLLTEKTEVGVNRVELATDAGILAEVDNNYGTAEDTYFVSDESGSVVVLKDSVLDNDAPLSPDLALAWQDLRDHVNEVEALLYAPDPSWEAISSLIDVESFIKYYFVLEVVENPDAALSSVFLYKDGPDDVLHAGPVWDFDIALGNYGAERLGGSPSADYTSNIILYRARGTSWYPELFRNEELVALANEMYATELADDVAALPADVDALKAEIATSAALNFELWPVLEEPSVLGPAAHPGATTWQGEVDQLRDWVGARVRYLESAHTEAMPLLRYPAHVARIGWRPPVTNGMMAGTVGRSLAMEALTLDVSGTALEGQLTARAHVQSIGWSDWVAEGDLIGTTGRGLRLEALQLRLTPELAVHHDISYRVHVQSLGWTDWVANGVTAGTTGQSLRVEAVQVRLSEKDEPGTSSSTVYRSHVQSTGWMPEVADGETSGTTGRALRMEALQLEVDSTEYAGDIEYRAHVQSVGWMPWQTSAGFIGTTGRALRMEALEIRLTGELAEHYRIRYRAHVQGTGWQSYRYDGQTAGTTGEARRVEAVTVDLVARTS